MKRHMDAYPYEPRRVTFPPPSDQIFSYIVRCFALHTCGGELHQRSLITMMFTFAAAMLYTSIAGLLVGS